MGSLTQSLSSFVSPHFSNTFTGLPILGSQSNSPTPRSPAPNLPVEILLQVLDYPAREVVSRFEKLTFFMDVAEHTQKSCLLYIRGSRSVLHNAALVNSTWCAAANEVLYSNVLLLTHHQVKCFHRTLQSRRSRKLAGLVKELSVLLASDDRLRGPTYRTYSPQGYRSFVERNKDLKNELRFILRSLPVLEYSSVRFLDPFSIAMGYGHFFGPCGIASHSLKNLIIHGISIFASFYEMSFPCLEVLCFHRIIFDPNFKFPALPRLSVLQLLRTSQRTGRVIHDLLTESKFPSLHTLQLYENRHLESSNNLSCPPHILDIRCLHLIGKAEISYFETLRRAGALDNLQHLAIGQIIRPFDPLRLWQFPTSIETLTFLVDTALTKNSSEESLFDSLQSELARHKEGFSRVRRIRVYVHGENVGDVARERMALDMYSAIYRTISKSLQHSLDIAYVLNTGPLTRYGQMDRVQSVFSSRGHSTSNVGLDTIHSSGFFRGPSNSTYSRGGIRSNMNLSSTPIGLSSSDSHSAPSITLDQMRIP